MIRSKIITKPIWKKKAFNSGWTYKRRILPIESGQSILSFLSNNYRHSNLQEWGKRIKDGNILLNNEKTTNDVIVNQKDEISWERPPWEEPQVPIHWEVLFDDGDLMIINKPSGLQVLPGGGFLNHTLMELMRLEYKQSGEDLIPKPIHRLGRFTSGLLMLARTKKTRSKYSKLLRGENPITNNFEKIYRTLAKPNSELNLDNYIEITTSIKQEEHSLTGLIWNEEPKYQDSVEITEKSKRKLNALSRVKLIERRKNADLLEVAIKTGRPHQIRIHLASLGTPLLGDPLYQGNGKISQLTTPGEGGYMLHSHYLKSLPIKNNKYTFEALPPPILQTCIERRNFNY